MKYKTDQERFWAAEFGSNYIDRNQEYTSMIHFLGKIISRTSSIKSVIEFGCNIGLNLKALNILLPKCELTGLEINTTACDRLREWKKCNVINESIFNYKGGKKYDLTMVQGVLIHINPSMLQNVYEKLYDGSNRYILISEYYNPTPVSIDYRGHSNRLFKRDFAGEMLDRYQDLELVDYGFLYHRDNYFQQDDMNWFLLKKK
jgi:pseudaminic acid biosynthesis-associated methylase